jgi:hypothetical protein
MGNYCFAKVSFRKKKINTSLNSSSFIFLNFGPVRKDHDSIYLCLFVFQGLSEPDDARKKKDLKKQMKKLMKKKLMKRLKKKMKEKLAKKMGQEKPYDKEMSRSCSDSNDSSSSDVSDDDSSSSDDSADNGSSDIMKSGRIPAGSASVEARNGGAASSKFIKEKNLFQIQFSGFFLIGGSLIFVTG